MKNIHPVFDKIVSREAKEIRLKQKAKVIWFTGLSGSGKTTVSSALEKKLFEMGYFTQLLDGDNIRSGINNNLGFSQDDRLENIRRIAEVSKLIMNCGVIVLCAFISPTDKIRNMAKNIIGEDDFIEVFVDTPIEECEQRDVKGLYEKARKGIIKDFTGVSAPFDKPADANVVIDTSVVPLDESVEKIFEVIKKDITAN
ncbi:adenylyl-sulfate kinase [uncultured Draconibacterium sp.]|uniref:adenylyl-sulfate kinase n=1 Tax=uncultured Draconibacterium sp. TaxID=1573823 RepID=UPI002AA78DE3|nr:adenylyl-sulfate kinase [uncultured Draconibacterium sp.]